MPSRNSHFPCDCRHHGPDSVELDTRPPELHLCVEPANKVEPSVVTKPNHVAGPVEPKRRDVRPVRSCRRRRAQTTAAPQSAVRSSSPFRPSRGRPRSPRCSGWCGEVAVSTGPQRFQSLVGGVAPTHKAHHLWAQDSEPRRRCTPRRLRTQRVRRSCPCLQNQKRHSQVNAAERVRAFCVGVAVVPTLDALRSTGAGLAPSPAQPTLHAQLLPVLAVPSVEFGAQAAHACPSPKQPALHRCSRCAVPSVESTERTDQAVQTEPSPKQPALQMAVVGVGVGRVGRVDIQHAAHATPQPALHAPQPKDAATSTHGKRRSARCTR